MAEAQKTPFPWPRNSWSILMKIVRAWYTAEADSGEVTQKKIAEMADVQQSQVSTNKAFLQAIGIGSSEGTSLTEAGKRVGIGLYNDNESMRQQGLQLIVRGNPLLKAMLDIIKGRGGLKLKDFSDEIALRTNGKSEGFATGVGILQEILIGSGSIEVLGDSLRPVKGRSEEYGLPTPGSKRIPIPVSTSSVWWIEVGDTPADEEIQRFLEMQKLMFGIK